MDGTTKLWLWIGCIGMTIGAVIFGSKAASMRKKEGMEFPLESFFITLVAATMYLTMALGETVTPVKGQEVFWGRYIDWSITTPLLLLELGVIAGLRPKLIIGVIGADLFMILTGMIAAFESRPNNYIWYIISCGAFLAILVSLLSEFTACAARRNHKVNNLFNTLRNVLIVLWFCYPIVWIFGAEGFKYIPTGTETALYAILDLCAKVGFGFIVNSAHSDTLAEASNTHSFMEAVHSYMGKGSREREREIERQREYT